MDSKMSSRSLLNIGNDVVMMILDELQQASPRSVVSMSLVHSSFRKLAQQCQYREMEFDHSSAASDRLKLASEKQLLSAVRSLKVKGDAVNDKSSPWGLLADLVPKMSGLKDITITSNNIPTEMVEAVQKCRDARLHIVICCHDRGECLTLKQLKGVANLYSLDVDATYGHSDCLHVTEPLRDVLLTCSNLRILKIDIHQPRAGCVMYGLGPQYLGCGFKDGERPPPLEVLELTDYPFGRPAPNDVARGFGYHYDGYPGSVMEEDYWADTFDWTRLRRLRTRSVWLAMKFLPHLTALREIEITGLGKDEDLKAFYAQIPSSLERISAPTLESIGIDSVLRHSSHLRSLQLHSKEDGRDTWREQTVNAESLRAIRDQCHLIEELDIDLARDGEWPYEVLDVLASFPRLKTLKLWLELGRNSDGSAVEPYATFSSCGTLFKYLWDHSAAQPPRLRELHVFSGAYRDIGIGYPSPNAFWSRYNSSTFLCSLSERDDEASQGVYVTTCPNLDASENKALQLALKHGKDPEKYIDRESGGRSKKAASKRTSRRSGRRDSFEDERERTLKHWADQASQERMKVAWKGPTSQNAWKPHY